ncbi:hypothetical protein CSUI_006870 [Cystoisospora suis]|uniref:Uncharacterized protein n=1 Tax=Cystoisospora suis TaxID=483139 RepID=A0A2C6KFM4_9APIC|nr:hypothetical protein CSUI_006870 [Cystoisospora suis]
MKRPPSRCLPERYRPKCRSRPLDEADAHPYSIEAILGSRARKKRAGNRAPFFSEMDRLRVAEHGRASARCVMY